EMQCPVAHRAAWPRRMAEDFRGVLRGQFRPARRFAERSALWTDGDPRIIGHVDILDGDNERIAARRSFEMNRPADWIGVRRTAIKARSPSGNRLIVRRFEIACAGVVSLDFEAFVGADAQQRLVAPVESVFARLFAEDPLHGEFLFASRRLLADLE